MFFASAVAALLTAASVAKATLVITQPTGAGWVGNTTVTVSWTWNNTDPNFTIELANPTINYGLLAQGPIAVANNVVPNTNSASFDLPVLPPGSDYQILFVAVSDINKVYAQSPSFPLSSNPTSSTVTGSNTAQAPGSTRSVSASTTRSATSARSSSSAASVSSTSASGSSSAAASSAAASSSSSSESRTALVISSLSAASSSGSAASASATPGGAVALKTGGWSLVGAVGAAVVGALVVA